MAFGKAPPLTTIFNCPGSADYQSATQQSAALRYVPCRAFTIIEIMTAMVIFCLIVAAIFQCYTAIIHGSTAGSRAAIAAQRSRVALGALQEALGATRSFVADSQLYTFDAENGTEPYISFVSRLSPSFPRSGRFRGFDPDTGLVTDYDVRRVTFAVESGPDWGKRLVLRQNPVLMDMDEDEQNYPVVLANDVRKFEMEFWDKKKNDWLDEWTETNQLPQMVKFTVQFGGGDPNSAPGDEITRIVALPSISVPPNWQAPGMALQTAGGIGGQIPGGGFSAPTPPNK